MSDHVTVGLSGSSVHLSNGQGLGEHNPAFDGFTAGLDVTWNARPRGVLPSPWSEQTGGRSNTVPGLLVDAVIGRGGEELIAAGRIRLAQRLGARANALLDVESGSLASEPFVEAGVAAIVMPGPTSLGVHLGYRNYVGLDRLVGALQVEWHVTDELTLLSSGHFEHGEFGFLGRDAIGYRAYPSRYVMWEMGVGFDDIGNREDVAEPYVGLEVLFPIPAPDWQFSVFGERIGELEWAGIRIGWGMGDSLRSRDRHELWRRYR